jgi:hypothetical protein
MAVDMIGKGRNGRLFPVPLSFSLAGSCLLGLCGLAFEPFLSFHHFPPSSACTAYQIVRCQVGQIRHPLHFPHHFLPHFPPICPWRQHPIKCASAFIHSPQSPIHPASIHIPRFQLHLSNFHPAILVMAIKIPFYYFGDFEWFQRKQCIYFR